MEKLTVFITARASNIETGLDYVRDAIRQNDNELAELFINVLKADFELLKVLLSIKREEMNNKNDNDEGELVKEVEEVLNEKNSLQN